MTRFARKRPSPATIISLIALFVALGGTGYAAFRVNTEDIAPRAVTEEKIAPGAVTGGKVRESTLKQVPSAKTAQRLSFIRQFFVKLNAGESQTIATHGNIKLVAQCVTDVPAAGDTDVRIVVETSDAGTVMNGDFNYDGSTAGGFVPQGPNSGRTLVSQLSSGQAGQTDVDGFIDNGWVIGADGKGFSIDAEETVLGVHHLGARCTYIGWLNYVNRTPAKSPKKKKKKKK
jgi:hypothetical protein